MILSVENLSFSYTRRPVLQDVSFAAEKGSFSPFSAPTAWEKARCFAAF